MSLPCHGSLCSSSRLGSVLAALSFIAAPGLAQVGSVVDTTKISDTSGTGIDGLLEEDDYFGSGMTALGDVDGDGVVDLAVGVPGETFPLDEADHDEVWILFMNADGSVREHTVIGQFIGGFDVDLPPGDIFGAFMAGVGDLDHDGVPELAVGLPWDDDGGRSKGAVWILRLKADGTVKAFQKISMLAGGFAGPLHRNEHFGSALAGLGDVDGDGIGDLAVGSGDALWILYLAADGTVKAQRENEAAAGGFVMGPALSPIGDLDGDGDLDLALTDVGVGTNGRVWILFLDADEAVEGTRVIEQHEVMVPGPQDGFGTSMTAVGDLDGDGDTELAVGAIYYEAPGTTFGQGAGVVVFPHPDGSVQKSLLFGSELGGLPPLPRGAYFGWSLAALGDPDGDGTLELVTSSPNDRDGGHEKGSLWVMHLDDSALRNGAGVNPLALHHAGEPALGSTFGLKLDCSGHADSIGIVVGSDRPHAGLATGAGELLIDLVAGRTLFRLPAPHDGDSVSFLLAVPPDPALFGLAVHVQGLCGGTPGAQLSNALNFIVGR